MASKTSRTFVWIILGLVMVGLIGFGATNFGGTIRSIGTVGDTDIDANRFYRELRGEMNAFEAQTGTAITIAQAISIGLDQQVLARVISSAALDNETAELGISVGDAEVRRQLLQIRDFQGLDGNFDRESYKFALDQNGLTAAEFETGLRADTARSILQAAIAGGVTTSPTYTDTLFDYARESRDFTWASLGADALETAPGTPSEADLVAYYEAHPADFTLPETKKITYAWLNPEDLVNTIEVDEAELRALYDQREAEYVMPERRIVERLVFATAAEAQAAADAIAAGDTDFEALVAARGLSLSDLDMGDVTRADLGAAGDAVFALTEPGIAGPVDSNLGPALFRMNAILAAQETPFAEVRDELQSEFAADRARREVADLVPALDDLLAGGATLEELARDHAMQLAQIDWFLGQDGGIAAYESFREIAGLVAVGDFPELTLMEDGGVFALRLDALVEPRLQTLDEVRDAVTARWRDAETIRLLKAQAEAYLPRIAAGESLSSLGLTEILETGITRDGFVEGTPPDFLTRIFEMAAGDWLVLDNTDGVVLVRLDQVNGADHQSDEAVAIKSGFGERMAQEIGLDIENAFSAALQTRAGVTLNQPVINAILGQF